MKNDSLDPRKGLDKNNPKVLSRQVFYKGSIIIQQGDEGRRAYYIERGRVEVLVKDQGSPHLLKVAELGPGDLFGEMSLITHAPRSATVRAMDDVTVTSISSDEIEGKIERIEDEAIRALINVLAERLRTSTKSQFAYYRDLSDFQDRISGVVERVDAGIDQTKRKDFRKEVTPLLGDLQKVLERYQQH